MTGHTEPDTAESPCWCCGTHKPGTDLHHLGEHPEVEICTDCTRWLHRRAMAHHDEHHPSLLTPLRHGFAALRATVIKHGWHNHPKIGKVLRRLDRHLP